jgi:hypothetical protein
MACNGNSNTGGHGSGLEFGYGTDLENARTLGYRESYVNQATQFIDEVMERASYGWIHPQTSLEGEFAIIFNPHGFPLSGPVSLDFNPMRFGSYSVEEIDGTPIPHKWDNFTLSFYVNDLPTFGWKKVRLVPLKPELESHIQAGPCQTIRLGINMSAFPFTRKRGM